MERVKMIKYSADVLDIKIVKIQNNSIQLKFDYPEIEKNSVYVPIRIESKTKAKTGNSYFHCITTHFFEINTDKTIDSKNIFTPSIISAITELSHACFGQHAATVMIYTSEYKSFEPFHYTPLGDVKKMVVRAIGMLN